MPYSKHPYKYPPEFELVLQHAAGKAAFRLAIPLPSASEAHGKKVQLQNYFSAVEHFAAGLDTDARKAAIDAERRPEWADKARGLRQQASEWALRATTARALRVTTTKPPDAPAVVVELRHAGAFGEALRQFDAQERGRQAALTGKVSVGGFTLAADLVRAQDELVAFINQGTAADWLGLEGPIAADPAGREAQARAAFDQHAPERVATVLNPACQIAALKRWREAQNLPAGD